jgi:hypothetical protein
MRRAYCKWAISKKKKTVEQWTEFERAFISFMRRAVLSKTASLHYSVENNARILHNRTTGLTVIIKGNSIRVHDETNIISFGVPSELGYYLDAIFDRANIRTVKRIEDSSSDMMLNSLREIQFGTDKQRVNFTKPGPKINKMAAVRRERPIKLEEIFQGANQ